MKKLFSGSIPEFFLCLTAVILLSGCQLFTPTPIPSPELFDTGPQTVILFLDMQPGLPMPTNTNGVQYCIPYPVIRVWGDNYTLLNTGGERILRDRINGGFLSTATRSAMYNLLVEDHFFTLNLAATPINPAGTSMMIGVKLKNQPVFSQSGNPGFINDQAFIDLIKPEVTPVSEQVTVDARVEEFFKQYSDCPRY